MNPVASAPRATFSIVPFSSAVKIGSGYQNASFMDTAGKSSIHWQNFQMPTKASWLPKSKFDLIAGMSTTSKPVTWAGCVEERPDPYMTTDTPASTTTPDTLFVPYFYPDVHTATYSSWSKTYTYGSSTNTYISLDSNGEAGACTNGDVYDKADASATHGSVPTNNTVANTVWDATQTKVCKYKTSGSKRRRADRHERFRFRLQRRTQSAVRQPAGHHPEQQQHHAHDGNQRALCQGRHQPPWRGDVGLAHDLAERAVQHPNDRNDRQSERQSLWVDWDRNHQRQGHDPDDRRLQPLGQHFGRSEQQRLFEPRLLQQCPARLDGLVQLSHLMDAKTLQACTNAKTAGIQIYTVGFSIPSDPIDTAGLSLLQSCATKPSMAYVAQDGSALINTFQQIANNMSGLRLTH